MYENITGVILSRGLSTRMRSEKAFLKYGNSNFIQHASDLMCSTFKKVIVISNSPQDYNFLNLPVFEDIYKSKGPLAGIHSALINSMDEKIFIIPCDMPFITTDFIKEIIDYPSKLPVVICKTNDFIHAQIGIYQKSLLKVLESILNRSNKDETKDKRYSKIIQIQKYAEIEIIEATKLLSYNDSIFFNVNKPEDYQEFLLKFGL